MRAKIFNRVIVYVIGLFFIATGVSVSVNANLGISPVNSLPYVVSKILNAPMSSCVIVIFCSYILLQILILRGEFNWINLTQIVFSTIFGYFVDFTNLLIGDWRIPTYAGSLVMLLISMVLIATGITLYVQANLVPMPMEGLALAIARKTGAAFPKMKILLDCTVVALSTVLCLLILGRLDGIREGTVISAIVIGRIIPYVKKLVGPMLEKFCGTEQKF